MKKFTLSILLFSFVLVSLKAQDQSAESKVKPATTEVARSQGIIVATAETRPLVLIDGIETNMGCLAINPQNIQKINVIKGKVALQEYGSKGSFGVIVITTRPGTEFMTITDFVNPEKNINKSVAKVQLDGELLPDMNKIVVDKSVFKQSMVSTVFKQDTQDCKLSTDDTLVVTTTLNQHKE